MAFNLEEWSKLSEAECERRYRQRLRDEERGKTSPKLSRSFSLSSSSLPFSGNSDREPRQRWPHLDALPRSGLMGAQARVMGALSD
jgi:hypothetical protein